MTAASVATTGRRHRLGILDPATYLTTLHLLLDLPVGIATFTIAVSLVSTSAALAVTVIGVPLLAGSLLVARSVIWVERKRATALLGVDLPAPPPAPRGWRRLADRTGWRAVTYAIVLLPLGVTTSTVALTGWTVAASALAFPAYAPFVDQSSVTIGGLAIGGGGWQLATSVAGALLLLAMPAVVRILARLDVAVMRRVLR